MVRAHAQGASCIPNLWMTELPWVEWLFYIRGVCHKSMDHVAALLGVVVCMWVEGSSGHGKGKNVIEFRRAVGSHWVQSKHPEG